MRHRPTMSSWLFCGCCRVDFCCLFWVSDMILTMTFFLWVLHTGSSLLRGHYPPPDNGGACQGAQTPFCNTDDAHFFFMVRLMSLLPYKDNLLKSTLDYLNCLHQQCALFEVQWKSLHIRGTRHYYPLSCQTIEYLSFHI